jgi:cysteine desulfurase
LRDRLERGLTEGIERVKVNGHPSERLPNTLNISFAFVEGESIMLKMPHVAVSSGSACTSSSLSTSHVLAAMGVGDDMGHGSLRLSVGRSTTAEQVDEVIGLVTSAVSQLREMSPLFEMSQAGVDISKLEWTGHEH